MGRLINYHIVFEENTQGQPRDGVWESARKRLEKKLMIMHAQGHVHFVPVGLKRMDKEGDEEEIPDEMERIQYHRDLYSRGFILTDKDGRRFPAKKLR